MQDVEAFGGEVEKRLCGMQAAVDILAQGEGKKRTARKPPLPLLTEMESPKGYHQPTIASAGANAPGKYHLVDGKMIRTEDL